MSDNGQQAPLIERLRSVPAAARVHWQTPNPLGYDTTRIPVGALCQEAADRIAELEAALAAERERREAAETDAGRYRWLREWRSRWEIRYWGGMFWDSFNADKLDAAIDKEAAKSPGTEPLQSKLVED